MTSQGVAFLTTREFDFGWDWRDDAACAGVDDPLAFHPETTGLGSVKHLKKIDALYCSTCPVRDHCREHALTNHEWGIWGGTNDKQRDAIRHARRTHKGNR